MLYEIENEIRGIEDAYDQVMGGMDATAKDGSQTRAYGGILRAGKGKLVEELARQVVQLAWIGLGKELGNLTIGREKIKIPIRKSYIERIPSVKVREYILKNINEYYYPLSVDLNVAIYGKFAVAIECKAYTENAMLKRVLVDFTLLKQVHKNIEPILFQLESQLGGDYSIPSVTILGSPSTHTLLSYFDIDLNIITLLEGERRVDEPIHKKGYYKPLTKDALKRAISAVSDILIKCS